MTLYKVFSFFTAIIVLLIVLAVSTHPPCLSLVAVSFFHLDEPLVFNPETHAGLAFSHSLDLHSCYNLGSINGKELNCNPRC